MYQVPSKRLEAYTDSSSTENTRSKRSASGGIGHIYRGPGNMAEWDPALRPKGILLSSRLLVFSVEVDWSDRCPFMDRTKLMDDT